MSTFQTKRPIANYDGILTELGDIDYLLSLGKLDIQVFRTPGTFSGAWKKPNYALFTMALLLGGGGGGGSGRRGAAASIRGGGGGGGGAACEIRVWPSFLLPETLDVTVGAGGAGKLTNTDTTNGTAGDAGTASTFNGVTANPGLGGGAGTSAAGGAGGAAGAATATLSTIGWSFAGTAGAASNTGAADPAAAANNTTLGGAPGGGAGGAISSGNVVRNGSKGGDAGITGEITGGAGGSNAGGSTADEISFRGTSSPIFRGTDVRVATTGAAILASSFENGDTVDGIVLATGDRILIKNQAVKSENGIYTVNASGAPTRATDMDGLDAFVNTEYYWYVQEGTINKNTFWSLQGLKSLGNFSLLGGFTFYKVSGYTPRQGSGGGGGAGSVLIGGSGAGSNGGNFGAGGGGGGGALNGNGSSQSQSGGDGIVVVITICGKNSVTN